MTAGVAGVRSVADCQAVGGNAYPKTMQEFQLLKQASLKQKEASQKPQAPLKTQTSIGRTSHPKLQPQTPDAGRCLTTSRSMQSRASPNQDPGAGVPGLRTQADMAPVDGNAYPRTMQEFQMMKRQSSLKAQGISETPIKPERTSLGFLGNPISLPGERVSPPGLGTPTKPERTSAGTPSKPERTSLGSLPSPTARAVRLTPVTPKTPGPEAGGRTLRHFQSLQDRSSGIANQAPPGTRTDEDVKPVGGDYYPKTVAEMQSMKKQASLKQRA